MQDAERQGRPIRNLIALFWKIHPLDATAGAEDLLHVCSHPFLNRGPGNARAPVGQYLVQIGLEAESIPVLLRREEIADLGERIEALLDVADVDRRLTHG